MSSNHRRPTRRRPSTRRVVLCLASASAFLSSVTYVYVYAPTTSFINGQLVQLHRLEEFLKDNHISSLDLNLADESGLVPSSPLGSARTPSASKRRRRPNPYPYIDASILLTGVAKDVDPLVVRAIVPKLRKLGRHFRLYHIIVYENNSGRESKDAWGEALGQGGMVDDFTLVSEDLPHQPGQQRTDRIAAARNRLLSIVHDNANDNNFRDDFDYLLVTDLDSVCGEHDQNLSYSPSVLREAIIDRGSEWDVITFRHEPYWDLWAFRHSRVFPFNMHGPRKEENWKPPYAGDVMAWVRSLDDTRMYEVESAFMMMAIYRMNVTAGVHYSGDGSVERGEGDAKDCEHVAFHRAMRRVHGARLRLWPVVYCQGAAWFREVNAVADSALEDRRIPVGNRTTENDSVAPERGNLLGLKKQRREAQRQAVQQDAGAKKTFSGSIKAGAAAAAPSQLVGATESSRPKGNDGKSDEITLKNILWSRNWQNVATCASVPAQYYQSPTESRQSVEAMVSYFGGCRGGVLWVRLGVLGAYDVTIFIDHILPNMTEPFTLVTTDGDNSIPGRCHNAAKLLESPLLIGWYTQNCDGCGGEEPHLSKLHPMPIGLDLHSRPTQGNFLKSKMNTEKGVKRMLALRRAQHSRNITLLLPPWNSEHHAERLRVEELVQCTSHEKRKKERISLWEMWELFTRYRFGFSPPGAGIDCHRTWEMLFFGMVPIVKTGPLDLLYRGLPVIIVKDWDDVCEVGFLETQYKQLPESTPDKVFTLRHWVPQD